MAADSHHGDSVIANDCWRGEKVRESKRGTGTAILGGRDGAEEVSRLASVWYGKGLHCLHGDLLKSLGGNVA